MGKLTGQVQPLPGQAVCGMALVSLARVALPQMSQGYAQLKLQTQISTTTGA
jgi:hypothetical protein